MIPADIQMQRMFTSLMVVQISLHFGLSHEINFQTWVPASTKWQSWHNLDDCWVAQKSVGVFLLVLAVS